MPEFKSVKLSELGTNCWSARRFVKGGRCQWVMVCNYPEKKNCKAIDAEIEYLEGQVSKEQERYSKILDKVRAMKGGAK